jgi:hypothetical protein
MNDPNPTMDDETLRSYLADALPAGELARVERALLDSSELKARLDDVRQNRGDPNLHPFGAVWRHDRLTCPSRQQLGSYLLDGLDPGLSDYLRFHLDVIDCPFCQANLADLQTRAEQPPAAVASRHNRILKSTSRHLLGDDRRD